MEPSDPHEPEAEAQVQQAAQEGAEGGGAGHREQPVKEATCQRVAAQGEELTGCAEESEVPGTVGPRLPERTVAGDSRRGHRLHTGT